MIRSYTRTGDRHLVRGAPCDDAVAAVRAGNYSLLTVFDGCSSSAYSREAARRLCDRLTDRRFRPPGTDAGETAPPLDELYSALSEPGNEESLLHLILRTVQEEAKAICEHFGCRRREICCTMIVALTEYHPDTRTNSAVILTVGDGFVAAYDRKSRSATLVTPGDNKDGNPCMTYFCTSSNAEEHAHLYRIEDFDTLLLSTDGITHAVNITDAEELTAFICEMGACCGISDADFAVRTDDKLADWVQLDPVRRDLSDDCGAVYYTTDRGVIKRCAKEYKHNL